MFLVRCRCFLNFDRDLKSLTHRTMKSNDSSSRRDSCFLFLLNIYKFLNVSVSGRIYDLYPSFRFEQREYTYTLKDYVTYGMTLYFHSYREIQETQTRNYKLEAYKASRASYRKSR